MIFQELFDCWKDSLRVENSKVNEEKKKKNLTSVLKLENPNSTMLILWILVTQQKNVVL